MYRYFAYGSNMHTAYLRRWLNSQGADLDGLGDATPAILRDYRMRTNYWSLRHRAGAANIEPARRQYVEGVVIPITSEIRKLLRKKEGWPRIYRERAVRAESLSERWTARAFTYMVAPDYRLPFDWPVSPRYRRIIMEAAKERRFTPSYRDQLDQLLYIATPQIECAQTLV